MTIAWIHDTFALSHESFLAVQVCTHIPIVLLMRCAPLLPWAHPIRFLCALARCAPCALKRIKSTSIWSQNLVCNQLKQLWLDVCPPPSQKRCLIGAVCKRILGPRLRDLNSYPSENISTGQQPFILEPFLQAAPKAHS